MHHCTDRARLLQGTLPPARPTTSAWTLARCLARMPLPPAPTRRLLAMSVHSMCLDVGCEQPWPHGVASPCCLASFLHDTLLTT